MIWLKNLRKVRYRTFQLHVRPGRGREPPRGAAGARARADAPGRELPGGLASGAGGSVAEGRAGPGLAGPLSDLQFLKLAHG